MSILSHNVPRAHVNKEILRAVAASGSSLNHPEIHRLARQMHQQDNLKNLKGWWHRDLPETRDASGTLYVPKVFDLSGNNADLERPTENRQPILFTTGIDFADNGNTVSIFSAIDAINPNLHGASVISISLWVYPQLLASGTGRNALYIGRCGSGSGMYSMEFTDSGTVRTFSRSTTTDTLVTVDSTSKVSASAWQHLALIIDYGNDEVNIFRNGSNIGSATDVGFGSTTYVRTIDTTTDFILGMVASGRDPDAYINDFRIFNTDITDDLTALFNESKTYYGL